VRDTRATHLNLASNLLDRLVEGGNDELGLAKMVVTLLPGDEGYVIALAQNGAETELCRLGYEDSASLLESLDMEELPVMINDLLADLDPDPGIFHSGCVVAEIRDLRPGGRPAKARHVLLRPSAQSLICDSQAMARAPGHARWTSEDRANLESQVVLASEGPLCLDPSPVVSFLAAKAHHARHKFATVPLRRATIKRYSQAGQNRKRKLESLAAPSELRLHDFIRCQRANPSTPAPGPTPGKRKVSPLESLRAHQEAAQASMRLAEAGGLPPPSCVTGSLNLAAPDLRLPVPAQVDVQKYVRPIGKRAETSDMTPQLVEEYVLETAERGQARVYHTRLTILQRQANDEYIGELYVERDFKEEDRKGSTCRFLLGTRTNALRYINQFTEIFTEEGRKNVKITHRVPNQQPRVTFTAGMRATMTAAAQAAQTASEAPAAAGGGGGAAVAAPAVAGGGGGGTPQAAILQSRALVTPPVTVVGQTGSSPAPQVSPMAKAQQHTVTVSSAGIQGPVSIQLQSPGRLVQGAQGQLATLVSTVKQQQASGQQGENQQEAISAIVQSLMRAETQFEQKKLEDSQRKVPSSPSPSLVSPGGSTPQLPTAPLPPSSLGPQRSATPRASLAGLLASPPPPQTVTVSSPAQLAVSGVSQLAAQLARPVASSSLPPSYSQALRDQQTSPRKRPEALTSPSPQQVSSEGGAAALSALLADTPAADKPLPPGQGVHNNNSNALLERLVSQSHAGVAGGVSQGSNLTPAASQLPSVHPNSSNGGGGEEITLQSLLSNPGKAPAQSPSKHSPLLQQLQQPVGQVRMYQPGASPRQPPASPRSSVTSPRSLSSPRPTPPSPRPPSALQQQLMQPPAPRYPQPTTHSSILSAALSSNISSSRSSQQLLQNLVQVSQAGQVVSVSLAADQTTSPPATTIAAPNGHLMVQGVQGGFQLVPQVGSHGQQLQLVQQSGNGGGVQLVNSVPGQGGQLQLVSQGQLSLAGQVTSQPQFQVVHPGQQLQIVQNQPVAGQPVSFAVNGVSQTVGRAATTMAKLVSSPNGAGQTLVVQGAGGNILLPQQQQFSLKQGGQVMVRQQQVVTGPVGAPAQVMVRPNQQPVQIQQPFQVVQVPANQIANHNQIIQIGRSMAVNNLVSVNKTPTVVGTPSPQGPPTPGLALSPALPSPSPQASTADPPLVVQMEGSHPHFLAQPQQIINNINNKPGPLNQTQFKIRQQRKQSLK